MKTKIIAMYLPQYHQIPENDEFWGKGFTDWVTVKNALPLFESHIQPRKPLNSNYYDLSKQDNVEWQAELAYNHGIYGFAVYHYWFNNDKNLLTKPAEILRDSNKCKIKYFLAWDNCNWKRSWSNVEGNDWAPIADKQSLKDEKKTQILIPYILGDKTDWKNHYDYCRTHFLSANYEKLNNKPVFCILGYSKKIAKMCSYWNELAKEDGFDGIAFIFKYAPYKGISSHSYCYRYQPQWSGWESMSFLKRVYRKLLKYFKVDIRKPINIIDYDKVWKKIINEANRCKSTTMFHGAFVGYDDSPRRGKNRSIIIIGQSPEKFDRYLKELLSISNKQNKEYVFLTAWNEWGEGAYLEPDDVNGYAYLNAIKKVSEEQDSN